MTEETGWGLDPWGIAAWGSVFDDFSVNEEIVIEKVDGVVESPGIHTFETE